MVYYLYVFKWINERNGCRGCFFDTVGAACPGQAAPGASAVSAAAYQIFASSGRLRGSSLTASVSELANNQTRSMLGLYMTRYVVLEMAAAVAWIRIASHQTTQTRNGVSDEE